MRFRILGRLELEGADGPIELRGRRRRALAAYLLCHHDEPLALDRIVDDLWDGELVTGAAGTVQTYISQLRRALPDVRIPKRPAGYVFELSRPEDLDAAFFDQLASEMTVATDAVARVSLGKQALDLFVGAALGEFVDADWAARAAAAFNSARLNIVERYVAAMLELGRHAEVIPQLEQTVALAPLDERFSAQLMVALYRAGRQSDALRAYGVLRRNLATELGIDPGPELQSLERLILEQDRELTYHAPIAVDPSGIGVVSFLLTDIVDSTRLWDEQPSEMSRALTRHEALLEGIVSAGGGRLVKHRGEGDSTLSVFERASDAVRTANQVVMAVRAESWPVKSGIQLRVGVHTGEAELRDGDYFGGTLNRAARLRALAGPNEIICSRATADVVIDSLPANMQLVERGLHQLRGLRRPEVVFAVAPVGDVAAARLADLKFRVLGDLTVGDAPIASAQLATVLARLLVDRNRTVTEGDLINAVWPEDPPTSARNSLQSKISRLRAVVGNDRVVHGSGGYRLVIASHEVDADRFDELVAHARAAGDPGSAIGALEEALGLWRGRPYGHLAGEDFVKAEAGRLEALRRSAEDLHLELAIEVSSPEDVLAESERLIERDPFRESAWAVRVRMLARSGRRVEALRELHEYRRRLAQETGLTPSPALVELERSLVDGEVPLSPANRRAPSSARHVTAASAVNRGGVPWHGPVVAERRLVGRDTELELVDGALESASDGIPRFVAVSGTAGVGKSCLLAEVLDRARDRGFRVLRATGFNSDRAPFSSLRRAAANLGHVLDDLDHELIRDTELAQTTWTERAARLADAILASASEEKVLLAVDDVQAIDEVSLSVLELVLAGASDEQTVRLVIVATYRPLGAAAHVASRVERMIRSPHGSEIPLHGLDEPELSELIADAAAVPPTPALIDALGECAGNPLLALAFLNSFAEAGALVVREGRLALSATAPAAVPYDLQDLATMYLRELESDDRIAFVCIALLGNGTDLSTVEVATGLSEDDLTELLQRGEDVGLVKIDSGRVVFVHELVRWSLTRTVRTATRRRLHRDIAARLMPETRADDGNAVALLASHLRASGDRSGDARIGYWSEIAGDHCLATASWGEAVRNYAAAIDATDVSDEARTELRLKAGIACFHHHDVPRARDHLGEVLHELDDRRSDVLFGTAALFLYRTALTLTSDTELFDGARQALLWFIDETAGDLSPEIARMRARALAQLAEATWGSRDTDATRRMVEAVRQAASKLDDDDVRSRMEMALGLPELASLRVSSARDHFLRSARHAAATRDPLYETTGLGRVGLTMVLSGEIGAARAMLSGVRERQYSMRFWSELSLTEALIASVQLLAANPSLGRASARDAIRFYERSAYQFVPGLAFPALAASLLAMGDHVGALATIDSWRAATPRGQTVFEVAVLAMSGARDQALARLRGNEIRVPEPTNLDLFNLGSFAAAVQAAVALKSTPVLTRMSPVLDDLMDRGVLATIGWPVFLPALGAEVAFAIGADDAERRRVFAHDALRQLIHS